MDADQPDQRPTIGPKHGRNDISRCIDWYHEGDTLMVEADGVHVAISYVRRKGRRCRLAVTAPPGATFQTNRRVSDAQKRPGQMPPKP